MLGVIFLWAGQGGGPSAWPIIANWLAKARRTAASAAFADLPDLLSADRAPLSLDFSDYLPADDALVSATASMTSATDPNATVLLWGAAHVAGGVATQWAGPGWVAGAAYSLKLVVITAAGMKIAGVARLRCPPPN